MLSSLKWQIFTSNVGYDYKSTIANTAFMQLAARLARYTDNITYAEWADKTFDWLDGVGFINTTTWLVNDGAGDTDNCTAGGSGALDIQCGHLDLCIGGHVQHY